MPLASQYPLITSPSISGRYFMTYDAASKESWVPQVSTSETSDSASEQYAGLGTVAPMREWIGGKHFGKPSEKSLTVTNKDFESSVTISNKDRRRDKTGQVNRIIDGLAYRAATWGETHLSRLLIAGTGTTLGAAWTGSSFFNASHDIGNGNTWNNTLSVDISALPTGDTTGSHGSTTTPSGGEMALSILQAIQQLYGFLDDQGEPTNQSIKNFLVMTPVSLYGAAVSACMTDTLALGFQNPLSKFPGISVRAVANARLSAWTTDFVVMATGGLTAPFLVQTEVAPTMKMLGDGTEYEFHNNAIAASVEMAGNVAYYAPDKAVKVTLT